MEGWIILHRKLGDNPLWLDEPFTRGQAWVDLLMLANHAPGFIHVQGVKINLKRGDVGKSEITLAARWKWSRGKVRRFVEELILEKMISKNSYKKTDKRKSVISICNYDSYQDVKRVSGTGDGTSDGTSDGQATDKRRTSDGTGTNNDNNETIKEKDYVGQGCPTPRPDPVEIEKQPEPPPTPPPEKPDPIPYQKIIDHLNERCGCQFRPTSQATRRHIKARWNEGFRVADFMAVIDYKHSEWSQDAKMCVFLRPETLFSNKFEGYLQAARNGPAPSTTSVATHDPVVARINEIEAKRGGKTAWEIAKEKQNARNANLQPASADTVQHPAGRRVQPGGDDHTQGLAQGNALVPGS